MVLLFTCPYTLYFNPVEPHGRAALHNRFLHNIIVMPCCHFPTVVVETRHCLVSTPSLPTALLYFCSSKALKKLSVEVFYLKKAIFTADVLKNGAASGKGGATESSLKAKKGWLPPEKVNYTVVMAFRCWRKFISTL